MVFGLVLTCSYSDPECSMAMAPQESAPDVELLLAHLEKGSSEERIDAVIQLGALGPYAQSAVVSLVKLLKSEDTTLQYECIAALGRIGPLAHDSSDSLTPFLKTDAEFLQSAALESLRRIGTASPEAEAQVRSLCLHDNASISTSAIRCLVMIAGENNEDVQKSIPRLVKALGDKRADVRNEAAVTLTEIGPSVVTAVGAVLTAKDPLVRLKACNVLGEIGIAAASAVPGLQLRLSDENELVVRAAISALGDIRSEPASVVPALNSLIQKGSTPIRITAVRAIAEFGPMAEGSAPLLLDLLSDKSIVLRSSAADALGAIGNDRSEVIEALAEALTKADGTLTVNAANALSRLGAKAVPALVGKLSDKSYQSLLVEVLGEMGAEAKSAVPALIELLGSENADLRREVYIALAAIGPEAAETTPAMMTILQDAQGTDAKAGAAYVLGNLGEQKAIPALKQILKDAILADTKDERLLRAVAWAIVKLEPKNAENAALVMPYLLPAASSEIPLVRKEAMSAFAILGPAAKAALPTLLEHAATDADASVRAESLHGLAEIQAPAAKALPIAIASLEDPDPSVRNSARYLLGRLGEEAHGAAPQLRETLRRGDPFERVLSAWALVHVESTPENIQTAIPLLLTGLQHVNPRVRAEVAVTLGKTGTDSPAVLSALESAQNDPDAEAKAAAANALAMLKKGK